MVSVSGGSAQPIKSITAGGGRVYPRYAGPTEVTPSATTQVLQVEGCLLNDDITIEAIPSNYGKITWNGSTLTVS